MVVAKAEQLIGSRPEVPSERKTHNLTEEGVPIRPQTRRRHHFSNTGFQFTPGAFIVGAVAYPAATKPCALRNLALCVLRRRNPKLAPGDAGTILIARPYETVSQVVGPHCRRFTMAVTASGRRPPTLWSRMIIDTPAILSAEHVRSCGAD
ncbi:MAG TPA: hypothetical protein VKB96_14555 [Gammaproteobacteria bacterium]|nr:hypothetical protein [Gammaproteobacteria bacterium]